eukprot:CAMPEP_0181090022 /NCGR_PEP_ID=MMETSP1071-20121207/7612_1 /TAXON_ID=35127 /ORGANISM="Thalassiosira sp., Strain NH16" /LENGTH=264 /DNA_ID=CAMNT_0023172005 /DNA_START=86 /DNA_END=880 /DNA_ORIENTATION=+
MKIATILSAAYLISPGRGVGHRMDVGVVHAFATSFISTRSSSITVGQHSCTATSLIQRDVTILPSSAYPANWASGATDKILVLFASNNDDDNDEKKNSRNNHVNNNDGKDQNNSLTGGIVDWISYRLERADFFEIRRDIILVTCFVLGRYLVYDISTGSKLVPGFDIQDIVWLSGTMSSAALLGLYWTAAGLLTRLFETRGAISLPANAVNIAMCCPLWIASEHFLQFGPADIGGRTLDASVANGFVGLTSFMAVMKTLTMDWR